MPVNRFFFGVFWLLALALYDGHSKHFLSPDQWLYWCLCTVTMKFLSYSFVVVFILWETECETLCNRWRRLREELRQINQSRLHIWLAGGGSYCRIWACRAASREILPQIQATLNWDANWFFLLAICCRFGFFFISGISSCIYAVKMYFTDCLYKSALLACNKSRARRGVGEMRFRCFVGKNFHWFWFGRTF